MTRAERMMQLRAAIYTREELDKRISLRKDERDRLAMLRLERDELRKQMGGKDRRELAQLLDEERRT